MIDASPQFEFTPRAIAAAQAIVSCFETGSPIGRASALAVLDDGAGISYGLHQATHKGGALAKIIEAYLASPNAKFKNEIGEIQPILSSFTDAAVASAAKSQSVKKALIAAAIDQEMIKAQKDVFNRHYLHPALDECERLKIRTALGLAVVYDSVIQSGLAGFRVRARHVPPHNPNESAWVIAYLDIRERFLRNLASKAARNSVYRPQSLRRLAQAGNWELQTPFAVNVGQSRIFISEKHLGGQ